MRHILRVASIMLALGCLTLVPMASSAQTPFTAAAADSTRVKYRVRNKADLVADQKREKREDEADREIARGIRQSIMLDKVLFTHAPNVKIISQNGIVTLKGSVPSQKEKSAIEAKAAEIVGEDGVLSQLEVQSKE
jgi:hyperosmotically inducible protein